MIETSSTDQPGPEPTDPTKCSGEEGFCSEHGFHRHSLKQPDRRRALAFNAVGPAINSAGYWLPLSARRAVADAILAAVDADAGYCPHCGRGDAGPTADQYEQQRQRAVRIQTLLDEQRDRVRKLAAEWQQTAARDYAVIDMGDAASALIAVLEPPKEQP